MERAQELARLAAAGVPRGVGPVGLVAVHAAQVVREIAAAVRDDDLQPRIFRQDAFVDERGHDLGLFDRLAGGIP